MTENADIRVLEARAQKISDQLDELIAVENPTEGQLEKMQRLTHGAEKLRVEIREARMGDLTRFAQTPGHIEHEAEPPAGTFQFKRSHRDPWDHQRSGIQVPGDVRDRALSAVERIEFGDVDVKVDATRERATRMIDANPDDVTMASYVVAVSSPAYRSAFRKLVRNPQVGVATLTEEERAAYAATQTPALRAMSEAGTGSYLVPFALDPSIVLTNAGSKNPFRAISRVETISTNVWHGVSSAGVTAEWTAEAAEWTDASPTFVQPTVTTAKGDAWLQASFEMVGDTNIDQQVGQLMSDAKDRLEATAFATGSGSGQPLGIVTKLQTVTASRVSATTNASFGAVDVFAMDNALPGRHRQNAAWVAHWSIFNLARQFATGTNTSTSFWVDLGPGRPSTLLGHPVFESSTMQAAPLSTATASSDDILVIGNFSEDFVIVDRLGTSMIYQPLVLGSNRRPTGEVGWAMYFRTGSDCLNGDAFRLLRA